MQQANRLISYTQHRHGRFETAQSEVITETPVTLTVNGEIWLTLMCTPVDLEALAVGFLYNEETIQSKDEIADVRVCATGDNVDVWLTHSVEKPTQWRRTSGCTGGMTSVGGAHPAGEAAPPLPQNSFALSPQTVSRLLDKLSGAQALYRVSGGVHTSALSDGQNILVVAEDIGRHNTLDKIAGRCLLDGIAPTHKVLLTTGRVSSEMMQKAIRIGAALVITRTSPSSLSIEMAERAGVTLIGYARGERFSVYCHPHRVMVAEIDS